MDEARESQPLLSPKQRKKNQTSAISSKLLCFLKITKNSFPQEFCKSTRFINKFAVELCDQYETAPIFTKRMLIANAFRVCSSILEPLVEKPPERLVEMGTDPYYIPTRPRPQGPKMQSDVWTNFLQYFLRSSRRNGFGTQLYVSDYELKCNHLLRCALLGPTALSALRRHFHRGSISEQNIFGVGNFEFRPFGESRDESSPKFVDRVAFALLHLIAPQLLSASVTFKEPNPNRCVRFCDAVNCGGVVELHLSTATDLTNAEMLINCVGWSLKVLECNPLALKRIKKLCLEKLISNRRDQNKSQFPMECLYHHEIRTLDLSNESMASVSSVFSLPYECTQLQFAVPFDQAIAVLLFWQKLKFRCRKLSTLRVRFVDSLECGQLAAEIMNSIERILEFSAKCSQSGVGELIVEYDEEVKATPDKNPQHQWVKALLEDPDFPQIWTNSRTDAESVRLDYVDENLWMKVRCGMKITNPEDGLLLINNAIPDAFIY